MANRKNPRRLDPDPTAQLTPNRGGDFVQGDPSLRDGTVPDASTVQSNHASTGYGGDDERADADDYKVSGRSRG